MPITNTISGTYTLDESSGLQTTADGTPSGSPRADSDIALTGGSPSLQADALAFYTYLFSTLSLSATYASGVGAAGSSTSIINVTDSSGSPISTIGFTDADGDSFLAADLVDSGVKTAVGEKTIYLVSALNDQVVLGMYDADGNGSLESVAFAVYMQPTGALDSNVDVQLFTVTFVPLEHNVDGNTTAAYDDSLDLLQNVYLTSTGELNITFDNMPSSANLFNDAAESASGGGIIVFGMNPVVDGAGKYTNASDVIHTSQGGDGATIGVNNQMFNPGEGAYFTFCRDIDDRYLSGVSGGLTATEADRQQNMLYDSLINSSGASLRITQTQGNDDAGMMITAFALASAYQGAQLLENRGENQVDIDAVYVWDSTHTNLLESFTGTGPDDDDISDTIVITITDGVASLTGLDDGYIVEWHTVSDHNQVLVQDTAGAWDLGGFGIKEGSSDTDSLAGHAYVEDDGPTINPLISDGTVNYVAASSVTNLLNGSAGSDQLGNWSVVSVTPSSQTLLGVTLLAAIDSGGTLVNMYKDTNGTAGYQSGAGGDLLYYTLSLIDNTSAGSDVTGSLDSYRFTVVNAPSAPPLEFNFAGLPSGQNLFGTVGSAGAPDGPGIVFFGADTDIKANGEYTNTSDTINTSQGGGPTTIGNSNQMIDSGEGVYFTIVNDPLDTYLANVLGGLDQNEADDADNMRFASLREVGSSFCRISQTQGSEVEAASFEAFNITSTDGRALLTNSGTGHVDILKVQVWSGAVGASTLLEWSNGLLDGGNNANITVTIDSDGVAHVSGLETGYAVEVFTDDYSTGAVEGVHDQLLVTGEVGKFDIGGFGTSQPQQVPDHYWDFTVQLMDSDGDYIQDTFRVTVDNLFI